MSSVLRSSSAAALVRRHVLPHSSLILNLVTSGMRSFNLQLKFEVRTFFIS